jgi:hypothetical protein
MRVFSYFVRGILEALTVRKNRDKLLISGELWINVGITPESGDKYHWCRRNLSLYNSEYPRASGDPGENIGFSGQARE